MKKHIPNFIDLFSGAGGFSLGFEKQGFNCIGAIDNDKYATDTHDYNFKNSKSICADIESIDPKDFAKIIDNQKVDIIIGGPPCPTFSTIGHAKIQSLGNNVYEDKRNRLFKNFLDYVEYFQPEFFVIENVPNFMTKYNGRIFRSALDRIQNIKGQYNISLPVKVLNAVNFGVPQNRKRMFLIGHKRKYKFEYPDETHFGFEECNKTLDLFMKKNLKKFINVYDAISDLPKITDNWRVDEVSYSKNSNLSDYQKMMRTNTRSSVRNNRCRMTNERAKKLFPHLKPGMKYMDLEPQIRKILPFREDIFFDRLKRIDYSKPCWTIIAHIGMDGYMYIHPEEQRTLSVREAARIQSFPDDFIFLGNMQQMYVQVGNAVPYLLSKRIAESLKKSLNY